MTLCICLVLGSSSPKPSSSSSSSASKPTKSLNANYQVIEIDDDEDISTSNQHFQPSFLTNPFQCFICSEHQTQPIASKNARLGTILTNCNHSVCNQCIFTMSSSTSKSLI